MSVLEATVRYTGGSSRAKLATDTRGTKENAASTGDGKILAHFTRPRMPASGHGN